MLDFLETNFMYQPDLEDRHTKVADRTIREILQNDHRWSDQQVSQVNFRNIHEYTAIPEEVKKLHQIIMNHSAEVDTFYRVS